MHGVVTSQQPSLSTWQHLPTKGSAGRSESLFIDEKEDLIGTGKNPLRKRATPRSSMIRQNKAKTDDVSFMIAGRSPWRFVEALGYFKFSDYNDLTVTPRHKALMVLILIQHGHF